MVVENGLPTLRGKHSRMTLTKDGGLDVYDEHGRIVATFVAAEVAGFLLEAGRAQAAELAADAAGDFVRDLLRR